MKQGGNILIITNKINSYESSDNEHIRCFYLITHLKNNMCEFE